MFLRGILGPANNHGEKWVSDVWHDHSNRVRALLGQAPGNQVRTVVQFADSRFNAFSKLLPHVSLAVDYGGNSKDRYTRFSSHVVDAGRLRGSSPVSVLRGRHRLLCKITFLLCLSELAARYISVLNCYKFIATCRLIDCIDDNYISVALDTIRLYDALVLYGCGEAVDLRRKLVDSLESSCNTALPDFSS